jgi:hypothetical protein
MAQAAMKDVNEAIVRNLSEFPFWTDKAKCGLTSDIGEDGLKKVEEACGFAYDQTDLWLHRSLQEAWNAVQARLRVKYPEYNDDAIKRIVTIAAYNWK